MSGRAKFVHWLVTGFEDMPNEPMFNVISNDKGINNGSTVTGDSLLKEYGIPLPIFPSLKTWQSETAAKRRCFRCWAVIRGAADGAHHREKVHGERFVTAPQILRAFGNMAVVAFMFLFAGCNAVRHLTGLDRHDATPVDVPVTTTIIRDLPAAAGITFSPDRINDAPTRVRVFVKTGDWLHASPGAWYEIPWAVDVDTRTTEYAVVNFTAQVARVYNQPAAPPRAIIVESIPPGAFDPGIPPQ